MQVSRIARSIIIGSGLALGVAGSLTGCDSSSTDTKQAVQDPAEVKKREQMIQDAYKANPPAKGPGGKIPGKATGGTAR
jgi:hypothetical protein